MIIAFQCRQRLSAKKNVTLGMKNRTIQLFYCGNNVAAKFCMQRKAEYAASTIASIVGIRSVRPGDT